MYYDPGAPPFTPSEESTYYTKYGSGGCHSILRNSDTQNIECGECRENYYNITIIDCVGCSLPGCHKCNSSHCLTGCSDGLFMNSTANTCDFCFLSCKKCENRGPEQCTVCKTGFYWSKNDYNDLGACLPCNARCKTCYGPANNQCGELKQGFFYVGFGTDSNSTQACSSACGNCENDSNTCTECFTGSYLSFDQYIRYDNHTCQLSSNVDVLYPFCSDLTVHDNSSIECNRCLSRYFYDLIDYAGCKPFSIIVNCITHTLSSDNRSIDCVDCLNGYSYNYDTKTCIPYTSSNLPNCRTPVAFGLKLYCMKCTGTTRAQDPETGICVTTCTASAYTGRPRKALDYGGVRLCYQIPVGCLDGVLTSGSLFNCTVCDAPNFLKYDVNDRNCLNLVCNSLYEGVNKQCTPALSSNCHPTLCMWTNLTDQCSGGACVYEMIEVVFNGTELALKITDKLDYLFDFDVKDYAVYETIGPSEKRVFCRMISNDIVDELSTCTYKGNYLLLQLVPTTYRKLVAQGFINLKKKAFKIERRLLSLDGVDVSDPLGPHQLVFNSIAKLNNDSRRTGSWFAVYQKNMPRVTGLVAEVSSKSENLGMKNYEWECVDVGGDAMLKEELNILLRQVKSSPLALTVTNSNFDDKIVAIKLSVTDEFNQTHDSYFSFTFVSTKPALIPATNEAVFYVDGENGVYVALLNTVQNINPNDVTFTANGLTGSFVASIQKRANHYVAHLKMTNGNDFDIDIGYLTYKKSRIQLIRVKPNYISQAIHESVSDNLSPFKLGFISRISTFQLYCVDESAEKGCLPNPGSQLYINNDLLTLTDPFNYTSSDAQIYLFIRIGTGYFDTITSVSFTGKTSAQLQTPTLDSNLSIVYPAHPHDLPLSSSAYFDTRTEAVTSATGILSDYTNTSGYNSQFTPALSLGLSSKQIFADSLPSSILSRIGMNLAYDSGQTHSLTAQWHSPLPLDLLVQPTHSLNSDGIVQLAVSVALTSRGMCNDPPAGFTFLTVIEDRFYLADFSGYSNRNLIPHVYSDRQLNPIRSELHSYCGVFSSSNYSFKDQTNQSFASSLASYSTYILLKTSLNTRDNMNTMNLLMAQFNRLYSRCANESYCPVLLSDIRTESAKILAKLIEFYEDDRFAMLVRYSLIGSFVWEDYFVVDTTLKSLLDVIEKTSDYIDTKFIPLLQTYTRFERNLRALVAQANMLVPKYIDFLTSTASNILSNIIFSYLPDADRNLQIGRAFKMIMRQYEKKMLKVSSHLKPVEFEDKNFRIVGMTVLSPLLSEYKIVLDNDTVIVIKDMVFSSTDPYYEIIVVGWKEALLTRLKGFYSDDLNEFLKQPIYVDFVNYFTDKIPTSGQVLVYRRPAVCPAPNTTNCIPGPTVVDHSVCQCLELSTFTTKTPSLGTRTAPPPIDPPLGFPNTNQPNGGPVIPPNQNNNSAGNNQGGGSVLTKPSTDTLVITNANFTLFATSTIGVELFLLIFYISFVAIKDKLDKIANEFADKISTKMLINKLMLDSLEKESNDIFSENNNHNNDFEEDSDTLTVSDLQQDQQRVYKKLKAISKLDSSIDLKTLKPSDLRLVKPVEFFIDFLTLNHTCSSLIYLKSSQYTRFSMITMTYLRLFAHLAVSMYFIMGKH